MNGRSSLTENESRWGRRRPSPEDRTSPVQIEAGVIAMADDVWAWCEKTSSHGRTVTVKIKWADFQISTRSRSMEMTIQTRETLHQVALDMIRRRKAFDLSAWRSRTFDRKSPAK